MMIVLAYDLSPSAARAAALIAHTPWPTGTVVRIVTSPSGTGPAPSSFAGLEEYRAHHRARSRAIEVAQGDIAKELAASGLIVQTVVARGRPEWSVVREAAAAGADLIVGGARNQGPLQATLLGSVSGAIVERAHCSVLIARGTSLARVLFATDGSAPAGAATRLLAEWPAFARSRIRVVGVGTSGPEYAGSLRSADEVAAAYDHAHSAALPVEEAILRDTVQILRRSHPDVEGQVLTGDPGRIIIGAAQAFAADLVVLGSDRAARRRWLGLGSVARQVLQGIDASALTARSPDRAEADPVVGER